MEKQIKICHLTSAHQADDIRIYHKECKFLAKINRFKIYLIAVNAKEIYQDNVQIISAKCKFSNRTSRIVLAAYSVYKKGLEIDADIYHFHDPELLPYGLKLKRMGKFVIYDSHEDVPRQILGKHWIPKYLRKIISITFETFENYIAKRLSYIITSTPTIEHRYLKINPNSSAICNYPILNENNELITWESRKNELCYVGGITVIRGIIELIKVMDMIPYRLNLAGSYSPLILRDKLVSMPGWEKVNDCGQIGRNEIIQLLNQSKIGIVTLHPKENYLESLPIKMFEYMHAGIPVIASNFPLWQEILTENKCGICVDPFNLDQIAEAIKYLLNNEGEARIMGINGREAVTKKYNWENEVKKLENIYINAFNKK